MQTAPISPIAAAKGAYRSILAFWQKKSIERPIHRFDASADLEHLPEGYLTEPGMVDPEAVIEALPPVRFGRDGVGTSHEITPEIGRLAAQVIETLRPRITGYLGPAARLDDLMLFWFDPSKAEAKNISGGWHDDNVGHRLKLYICLRGDGSTPTAYIPGTHRAPYRYKWSEFGRFAGVQDVSSRPGEVFIRYRTGDVALFDTNGLHRGYYEEPAGERIVLVAEFIDRHKSNLIAGRAPCAPQSSRLGKLVFQPGALEALQATGLVDEELLSRAGDAATYSLANRRAG